MGRTGLFQHGRELFFCDWKLQLLEKQQNTQVPSTLNVPCRSRQRRVQSVSPACRVPAVLLLPHMTSCSEPSLLPMHVHVPGDLVISICPTSRTWTPHPNPSDRVLLQSRERSVTHLKSQVLWAIRAPKENLSWVWTTMWKEVVRYELKVVSWTH